MANSLNLNYQITNAPTSEEDPDKIKDDGYLVQLQPDGEKEFEIPATVGDLKKVFIGDLDKYE